MTLETCAQRDSHRRTRPRASATITAPTCRQRPTGERYSLATGGGATPARRSRCRAALVGAPRPLASQQPPLVGRRPAAPAAVAVAEAVEARRGTTVMSAGRARHRALAAVAAGRRTSPESQSRVRRAGRAEAASARTASTMQAFAKHSCVDWQSAIGLAVEVRDVREDERLLGIDAGVGAELRARLIAERRDADLDELAVDHRERRAARVALALALAAGLVEAQEVRVRGRSIAACSDTTVCMTAYSMPTPVAPVPRRRRSRPSSPSTPTGACVGSRLS